MAAAKKLIAETGATTVPVELTFENSLTDARVAQIVQTMAKEAGFDVKLLPLETTTAIQRYLAGNFEMYIGNWSGRGDPDPRCTPSSAAPAARTSTSTATRNSRASLNEARAEGNVDKRKQLYAKATGIYLADLPTIPIYHPNWIFAARANVDGIQVYPDGLLRLKGVKPAQ